MVTDAAVADLNKDGWPDLVVAGEWMAVKVFYNQQGKAFVDQTAALGMDTKTGWWASLQMADLDQDGDLDILAGNAGENLVVHASEKEPMEYFQQDINGDGGLDPVFTYYIQGKSYPAHSFDELAEQVPSIRKKFYTYADYARAEIADLMSKEQLNTAGYLNITELRSGWWENKGAERWVFHPFAKSLQVSPIQNFTILQNDKELQIVCAGNFYPFKVEWGRSDAFSGAVLIPSKNGPVIRTDLSPLRLGGDIRNMQLLDAKTGSPKLLVLRNNAAPSLLKTK